MTTSRPTPRAVALLVALGTVMAAGADTRNGLSLNRYATTERSYGANAYWIESATGLVLIDALFLVADAENLATVLASRGKPMTGIILTHPHVDHFGGLGTLRRRFPGVPVYATAGTAAGVAKAHQRAFDEGWIQQLGADYDPVAVTPDRVVESGTTIELAGMHLTITSFGAMEADDNALILCPEMEALFTGDAVVNGPVYYLGEGHSAGAIAGLEAIAEHYPATTRAYPAHGDPGRLGALVERGLEQVRFMRAQVLDALDRPRALLPEGRLADPARARLIGIFGERFRDALSYGVGVETLAAMNVLGLERELLAERAPRARRATAAGAGD